ncbi:MAG: adenylate/guanylate cyclase domain-containing protein [Candidatus Methylomirabilales bacterium]
MGVAGSRFRERRLGPVGGQFRVGEQVPQGAPTEPTTKSPPVSYLKEKNMDTSNHLETLLQAKHGFTNLQVVFTDIEKYSLRKSTVQKSIIEAFTNVVKKSLHTITHNYLAYAQAHNANFSTDILKLTTGDGLAIVFTFEGLQRIHLDFAESLLSEIHKKNQKTPCSRFENTGWCNCHNNFRVRVGISEGKGIMYKDVNGSYNVAGGAINLAARIMGLGEGMKVLVSELAYRNVIDMTTDMELEDKFRVFEGIIVKHGLELNVYQYCPPDKVFINCDEPKALTLNMKMREVQHMMWPRLQKLGNQIRTAWWTWGGMRTYPAA